MSADQTRRAVDFIRSHPELSTRARITLLALADHVNKAHGDTCFPGQATLCDFTGLKPTAQKAGIRDLEAAGLLTTEARYRSEGRGGRSSNLYRLRLPPVGKGRIPTISHDDLGTDNEDLRSDNDRGYGRITTDLGSDSDGDITKKGTKKREPRREEPRRESTASSSSSPTHSLNLGGRAGRGKSRAARAGSTPTSLAAVVSELHPDLHRGAVESTMRAERRAAARGGTASIQTVEDEMSGRRAA